MRKKTTKRTTKKTKTAFDRRFEKAICQAVREMSDKDILELVKKYWARNAPKKL